MFHYCDSCQDSIRDEATTVQVQSGPVVRMTDGSIRMNGRVPQHAILCVPCGKQVSDFMRSLLGPVPAG